MPKKRVVYEADDLEGVRKADKRERLSRQKQEANLPLSKRVALQKDKDTQLISVKSKYGSKEVAYVPKNARKKESEEDEEGKKGSHQRGERRGIKELRLKRQKF
jgi:hypothetical protein